MYTDPIADKEPMPIAKDQPRGLFNCQCHKNAYDHWQRTGQSGIAVCSISKYDHDRVAHLVNLNEKGEIIDNTWGATTHWHDHYFMFTCDFDNLSVGENLQRVKDVIVPSLSWWRRVKHRWWRHQC